MSEVKYSTRLNSFALGKGNKYPSGQESTVDLIKIAGTVEGLTSLELNYPEHFLDNSVDEIKLAAGNEGLSIEGIQLRWPAPKFSKGGFTNPDKALRDAAVQLVKEAIDVARQFEASHVLLWPAHDGYEYPFQMEYVQAWDYQVECLRELSDYAGEIRISIEYKPSEPRGRTILNTTGAVMKLVSDIDRENIGVTLDFGHLLMARENPAQSAAMVLRDGKLWGMQLNDSHGLADDGLVIGSIHLPAILELAYYLGKYEYSGTLYFDTDPVRENPVEECAMNIRRIKHLMSLGKELTKVSEVASGDALVASELTWKTLIGK
jgi:xylose isomerase